MHHVAILKKEWKLLDKIVSGKKTVESRWYVSKVAPWGKISAGDVVFFKESGSPVSAKANVEKIIQEELTPSKVKALMEKYGKAICVRDEAEFIKNNEKKKYGMLIFLKDAAKVEPFDIDKKGFGLMSAWLCVGDIANVKI